MWNGHQKLFRDKVQQNSSVQTNFMLANKFHKLTRRRVAHACIFDPHFHFYFSNIHTTVAANGLRHCVIPSTFWACVTVSQHSVIQKANCRLPLICPVAPTHLLSLDTKAWSALETLEIIKFPVIDTMQPDWQESVLHWANGQQRQPMAALDSVSIFVDDSSAWATDTKSWQTS